MPHTSLNLKIAFLLVGPYLLSGCATSLGYIKDHPEVEETKDYSAVKQWAFDVSDGYSSRGTMNRYSLYWGEVLAAGGVGALGGLAATGSTGHSSVIIPLAATFIGTMFGYYQNESQAQIYYAASQSINNLILKSENRYQFAANNNNQNVIGNDTKTLNPCSKTVSTTNSKIQDLFNSFMEEECNLQLDNQAVKRSKENILVNAKNITNLDLITAVAKSITDIDEKLLANSNKITSIDSNRKHLQEFKSNFINNTLDHYEANCLTRDTYAVMRKVQVHLMQLDPKNVSDDLLKVKGAGEAKDTSPTPPKAGKTDSGAITLSKEFDLSDLNPEKITSVCEIGIEK